MGTVTIQRDSLIIRYRLKGAPSREFVRYVYKPSHDENMATALAFLDDVKPESYTITRIQKLEEIVSKGGY